MLENLTKCELDIGMSMRIAFTGSLDGMTEQQKQTLIQVLQEYWPVEFHHADCVGADAEAHAIVQKHCTTARVIIHPPTDQKLRAFCVGDSQVPAKGYLSRNHDIARACDLLVAAPKTREEGRAQRDLGDDQVCEAEESDGGGVGVNQSVGLADDASSLTDVVNEERCLWFVSTEDLGKSRSSGT